MGHRQTEGRTPATIRYTLQPIPPKARNAGNKQRYAAHALIRTSTFNSIAQQMVREGSKYSAAEIVAIMTQMMDTIAYRLANGESVNLGSMVRLRPAIRGTFETEHSPFNPKEHQLVVTATIGNQLRKIVQSAKTEQVDYVTIPKLTSIEMVVASPSAEASINMVVHGRYLTKQPCKKPSEWFIQVGEQRIPLTPFACDNHCALFTIPQEILPTDTQFTLGLRVYTKPNKPNDILYKEMLQL